MQNPTCLIVDDEPAIRSYLRQVLQLDHIDSVEAEGPAKALQLLRDLGGGIDFIITDVQMPGDMDGIDFAYSVRHSAPHMPVILISGYAGEAVPGSFDFIPKPFAPNAILEAVHRVLPTLH